MQAEDEDNDDDDCVHSRVEGKNYLGHFSGDFHLQILKNKNSMMFVRISIMLMTLLSSSPVRLIPRHVKKEKLKKKDTLVLRSMAIQSPDSVREETGSSCVSQEIENEMLP